MVADLARHLVVGLEGPELSDLERSWLEYHQPSGVILFSRNCLSFSQLFGLCAVLRELVPDLEIMADHEGGPVSQLARAVGRPPVPWSLGVLDDLGLTARVHAETGRRLQAAGITRVLAPVVDVLTAADNPVIGARAFGASEARVTRHTVAAVTGLLGAGLQVCLKHWPGHGGSRTDTHEADAEAGTGAIAGPFTAGLNAGADAVMIGHLRHAGATELPATLDRKFLRASGKRWQDGCGFRPRLIADDVTMGGLRAGMASLGVTVDGNPAKGMLAPENLSLDWFGALLDAGCQTLLVRGLPLRALPVPGRRAVRSSRSRPHSGDTGSTVAPTFTDAAYTEARRRSWELVADGFAACDRELFWWDETVGDRWQVAGGDPGPARELLAPCLAAQFAGLRFWPRCDGAVAPATRLLVTSHRPLDLPGTRDERIAEQGVCLAMGHPSLAEALSRYLGAGWRVGAVYDVAPNDLFCSG